MNYTYYDYLDLPPGASAARIEAAYVGLLERFGYGTTDAGQDMSGLVRMLHTAYEVLSNPDARHRYDCTLVQEAAMADAELKASLDREANGKEATGTRRRVQDPPAARRNTVRAIAA